MAAYNHRRLDSLQVQRQAGDSECFYDNNNKDDSRNTTNNFYNSPSHFPEHGSLKAQEGNNASSINGSYKLLDRDTDNYFIDKIYAITESNELINKKDDKADASFSNARLDDVGKSDDSLLVESLQNKAASMTTSTELDHNINAPNILTIDMDDDYLVPPFNLIKMATPLPATADDTDDGTADSDPTRTKTNFDVIGSDNYINKNNVFNYSPSTVFNKDDVCAVDVFNFNCLGFLSENQINEIDHFQNKYDNNKNVYVNKNNQKNFGTDIKNTHDNDINKNLYKNNQINTEETNIYKEGGYQVDLTPLVVVVGDNKAPVPSPV